MAAADVLQAHENTTATAITRRPLLAMKANTRPLFDNPDMKMRLPSSQEKQPGLWKYAIAWLLMLLLSIINGTIREISYGPLLPELRAHQLSTLSEILLLGILIYHFMRHHPPSSPKQAFLLGLNWATCTVAFEFLFFHFVAGHPWSVLLANYRLQDGRIWIFVLLWLVIAPPLFLHLADAPKPGEH